MYLSSAEAAPSKYEKSLVSSAYKEMKFLTKEDESATNIRNSAGPMMEPWGTPLSTGAVLE